MAVSRSAELSLSLEPGLPTHDSPSPLLLGSVPSSGRASCWPTESSLPSKSSPLGLSCIPLLLSSLIAKATFIFAKFLLLSAQEQRSFPFSYILPSCTHPLLGCFASVLCSPLSAGRCEELKWTVGYFEAKLIPQRWPTQASARARSRAMRMRGNRSPCFPPAKEVRGSAPGSPALQVPTPIGAAGRPLRGLGPVITSSGLPLAQVAK